MQALPLLHYEMKGEGEVIVLLHGYLSSSHYFKNIRSRLATTHKVVSLDLLGFGQSPKPRGAYTYEDHIDAIKRTLDHLEISRPFILLGHSMGALIALRYARQYGEEVGHLMLFNPPFFTSIDQMSALHKARSRTHRALLYSPVRRSYWKALRLIPHQRSNRRPAINFADTVRMSRHAREGSYINILGGSEFFSDIQSTTMPVLLIHGRYDRVVYADNLLNRVLPPNVQLEIVESGHHPLVRNTDLSETLIRQYLRT